MYLSGVPDCPYGFDCNPASPMSPTLDYGACEDGFDCDGVGGSHAMAGLGGGARPMRSATSRWVSPPTFYGVGARRLVSVPTVRPTMPNRYMTPPRDYWTPDASSARFFLPSVYVPPYSGGSRYEQRY